MTKNDPKNTVKLLVIFPAIVSYNEYIINQLTLLTYDYNKTVKRRWLFEIASVDRRSQRRRILLAKAALKKVTRKLQKVHNKMCTTVQLWGRERGVFAVR